MTSREASRVTGVRPSDLVRLVRESLFHNLGLKLLSILVAFGLWFFVNASERDTEAAFHVALELHNIPDNLVLVSPRVDFVDLRVSGPRTLLGRIDPTALAVPLDLGGVRPGPAVFRVRTDSLSLPRGVNVVRLTPSEVTLSFARVARKSVPVRVALAGKPPLELRVTDTRVEPETVEVIGPEDEVQESRAVETLPIDLSDARPGRSERDVALAAPGEHLSFSAGLVRVQIRLEEPEIERVLEQVPVVVRGSAYRTELSPKEIRIRVRGPRSVVESLELVEGAVYIDAADQGPGQYKLEPRVDLPVDVELVSRKPGKLRLEVLTEKRRLDGE